ncbi:ribonuclease P protein component [Brevibacterium litoralis]|uniref:ribonuclease P protein component n=1 Tax=Brevibacterium litoralis TaxID=3138935 RepID=UPI0032EFF557
MLPGDNRIRRPEDFRSVHRSGRKAGSRYLVLHHLRSNEPHAPRVGFVVSKAVGNAVVRNRVKRRLRDVFHRRLDSLEPGESFVVRVLPAAAGADHAELTRTIDRLVPKVRALPDRPTGARRAERPARARR